MKVVLLRSGNCVVGPRIWVLIIGTSPDSGPNQSRTKIFIFCNSFSIFSMNLSLKPTNILHLLTLLVHLGRSLTLIHFLQNSNC